MTTHRVTAQPSVFVPHRARKPRLGFAQIALGVAAGVALLGVLGWTGLQWRPAPFPAFAQTQPTLETISLPANLPAPVSRFYRAVYGETIPVIKSAVISGRAEVRPAGPVYLPARFRFTHAAGQGYRHYIEAGLFGLPMMQVDERYLDGQALGITPFGVDKGDRVNQAANLGMWAEMLWMPSVFLTDPRVHWQAVDDSTAILVVPFETGEEHFVVRFNPETGLIEWLESMRYQNQASSDKVLWLNKAVKWETLDGVLTNTVGSATWMNNGTPWAIFYVDDIVVNADVSEYIRAKGY